MFRRIVALGLSCFVWGWLGLWAILRRKERDECVILYYHGVSEAQLTGFRRQMQWLASHGNVVPLLKANECAGRCACLTFDDGLDSVRTNALPILRELRLPATVFAVSGNLGRRPAWEIPSDNPERDDLLSSAAQLREFPSEFIEIGSHTVSHRNLRNLTEAEVRRELVQSKHELELVLGRAVSSFSAPFGECTEAALQTAREVGYKAVVTCEPRPVRSGESLIGAGRFKVTPEDWFVEFRLKAVGAYRWRNVWRAVKGRGAPVRVSQRTSFVGASKGRSSRA